MNERTARGCEIAQGKEAAEYKWAHLSNPVASKSACRYLSRRVPVLGNPGDMGTAAVSGGESGPRVHEAKWKRL